MAARMVVVVSVLILSSNRGKPVTENKAYAKCANIKATNVPKFNSGKVGICQVL